MISDQTAVSSLILIYKNAKLLIADDEAVYGCVIVTMKLCENYRTTRDIINAISFELEGRPCLDLETYLDKKAFLINAEIAVLKLFEFNLNRYKTDKHYSLLLTIAHLIEMPKALLRLSFVFLTETFLYVNLEPGQYSNMVASAICMAITYLKNNKINCEWSIEDNWYLSFNFERDTVLDGYKKLYFMLWQ